MQSCPFAFVRVALQARADRPARDEGFARETKGLKRLIWAAAAGACLVCSAAVADDTGGKKPFQPEDLFALQAASDPQISPDGQQIAYVRLAYDIMTDKPRRTIWILDVASGAQKPMDGADGEGSPRWSPDGHRLAYVAPGPEGRPELHVRWVASGESDLVADLANGPGDVSWSPDGRQLVFSSRVPAPSPTLGEPPKKPDGAKWADPIKVITRVHYRQDEAGYLKNGYTHLFIVSADGGAPRQLTFGAYDDHDAVFTPDGRSLIFVSERVEGWELDAENSGLFRLTLADGTVTPLPHKYGPDRSPAVSPDGRFVAYTHYDDRHRGYEDARLHVMDLATGQDRSLTDAFDRSVERPLWNGDGKSLFVQFDDHGVSKVGRVSLAGEVSVVVSGLGGAELDRPYTGGSYSVSRNGLVAFTFGDPATPDDVGLARAGSATRRLTDLNADLFAGRALAKVEPLKVDSSFDKRPIDAWIMTPPDFQPGRKYPMILEIHGGPFAAYGPSFASQLQLYAAAG